MSNINGNAFTLEQKILNLVKEKYKASDDDWARRTINDNWTLSELLAYISDALEEMFEK